MSSLICNKHFQIPRRVLRSVSYPTAPHVCIAWAFFLLLSQRSSFYFSLNVRGFLIFSQRASFPYFLSTREMSNCRRGWAGCRANHRIATGRCSRTSGARCQLRRCRRGSKPCSRPRPSTVAEAALFGASTCPDEINYEKSDLAMILADYWGKRVELAVRLFAGRTGFGACSHHVPETATPSFSLDRTSASQRMASSTSTSVRARMRNLPRATRWPARTTSDVPSRAILCPRTTSSSHRPTCRCGTPRSTLQGTVFKSSRAPSRSPRSRWSHTAWSKRPCSASTIVDYNSNFAPSNINLVGGLQINLPQKCERPLRLQEGRRVHRPHEHLQSHQREG